MPNGLSKDGQTQRMKSIEYIEEYINTQVLILADVTGQHYFEQKYISCRRQKVR